MLTFSKKKTEQALVTIQGTVPKHMLLSILVRVLLMCRKQMALKRAADQRGLSVSEAEAYLTNCEALAASGDQLPLERQQIARIA